MTNSLHTFNRARNAPDRYTFGGQLRIYFSGTYNYKRKDDHSQVILLKGKYREINFMNEWKGNLKQQGMASRESLKTRKKYLKGPRKWLKGAEKWLKDLERLLIGPKKCVPVSENCVPGLENCAPGLESCLP